VSEVCGLVLTLKKVLDSIPMFQDEKADFAGWDVRTKHISFKVLASGLWHDLGQYSLIQFGCNQSSSTFKKKFKRHDSDQCAVSYSHYNSESERFNDPRMWMREMGKPVTTSSSCGLISNSQCVQQHVRSARSPGHLEGLPLVSHAR
jgi:hypothetical protein